MARRTHYGKIICPTCREMVTTNGMGRTAHMRKHVREGTMVVLALVHAETGLPTDDLRYVTQAEARRRMENDTIVTWAVVEGKLEDVTHE